MPLDYGPATVLDGDRLERLQALTDRQLALENELEVLEARSKELGALLRQVSEIDIPELLDATGLSDVRLVNGVKVSVREDVRVTTTGRWRDAINAWLTREGHDDLIRDKVTADFSRGESVLAERTMALLREAGVVRIDRVQSVNPQTFAALIRELRTAGEDVPYEEIGVYVQKRAKLVRP